MELPVLIFSDDLDERLAASPLWGRILFLAGFCIASAFFSYRAYKKNIADTELQDRVMKLEEIVLQSSTNEKTNQSSGDQKTQPDGTQRTMHYNPPPEILLRPLLSSAQG